MKQPYTLSFLLPALLSLCSACTQTEDLPAPGNGQPVYTAYSIATHVLPMSGNLSAPVSRALEPMTPEEENMIRTVTVLQFDAENNLVPISDKENAAVSGSTHYYYFKDLTKEDATPNGTLTPRLDNVGLQYDEGQKTTVCLVANLSSEEQAKALTLKEDGTRVQLSDFQKKTIEIGNILTEDDGLSGDKANIGHVRQIHMFGHYSGELPPPPSSPSADKEATLSISLGRIIARIEVNFTLDNPAELTGKFYIGIANMEKEAYIFPGATSPNKGEWLDMKPTERSEEIKTGNCQLYFYAAPHSAKEKADATQLKIWYGTEENNLEEDNPTARILLCNNPDVEDDKAIEGDYFLNRNSIYHVNIHLTKQEAPTPTRCISSDAGGRTYVVGLP